MGDTPRLFDARRDERDACGIGFVADLGNRPSRAIVEALNKKSLDAVQSGQTPDFASVEPATNRQAQTTKVSTKAVVRHRATTKAKKGA